MLYIKTHIYYRYKVYMRILIYNINYIQMIYSTIMLFDTTQS